MSTVQRGMPVQPDADSCTPGHTLYIQFSAEWAANVVDLDGWLFSITQQEYDWHLLKQSE